MPRPFAYFTGSQITGTEKYGNLSVGASTQNYSGRYGGAKWWNGPDESIGWVIAFAREDNQQPGFIRTDNKTDAEFLSMVNNLSPRRELTPFTDGAAAKTWLNANGYWTNWSPSGGYTNTAGLYYDPGNTSSYSGSGTTLTNIGTEGNVSGTQGTLSGVAYESGVASGVFNFDGGTDRITFSTYDFTNTFTVTAWVYPRSQNSINTLLANGAGGFGVSGFKLGWNTWNTQDNKITIEMGNGTAGALYASTNSEVVEGEWQFLSYALNLSTLSFELYRNGSSVSSGVATGPLPSGIGTNNSWDIGSMKGGYYMNANLGEIRIYDSVRSSTEIATEYNDTKSRYGL